MRLFLFLIGCSVQNILRTDVGRNKRSAVQAIASHGVELPELRFAYLRLKNLNKLKNALAVCLVGRAV
jgi:predicted RNA-binding protein with EMAP domain